MRHNVKCDRGGAGGWSAHGGLYTMLKKPRTFEMDVIQKWHVEKLSSLAHYNIYIWSLVPILVN